MKRDMELNKGHFSDLRSTADGTFFFDTTGTDKFVTFHGGGEPE